MSLSGNITFKMSAQFFASFSKYLIIEFPKRGDSWVERLLNNKVEFKEHFSFYDEDSFEREFAVYFDILEKQTVKGSKRIMYLLKVKNVK